MTIQLSDILFNIPSHVSEITLRKRMEYDIMYGDEINEAITELSANKDLSKEEVTDAYSIIYIDRAQKTLSFFSGVDLETVQLISLGEIIRIYELHLKDIIELPEAPEGVNTFLVNDVLYWLPEPVVTPSNKFTFNEFITSKEIIRNMNSSSSQKLAAFAYLGAIFFRPLDDKFQESDIDDTNTKVDFIFDLPLPTAMQIGLFYDKWSEYIGQSFSVFGKAKKGGIDTRAHFEKWGWVAFLNYVAEKGSIFYKANQKTNLENIKEANLYDVLMWASCQKDLDDIIGAHYDKLNKQP